ARGPVLGHGDAREGAAEDLRMRGDEPGPVVDVNAVFCFSDLELTPDQQIGHRIAMPVHIDKAFDVDQAMVQGVDLRHEERQRTQVRPFGAKSSRGLACRCRFGVALTLSQKTRAWALRSARSAKVRPARKLCSMKRNGRSTRAE